MTLFIFLYDLHIYYTVNLDNSSQKIESQLLTVVIEFPVPPGDLSPEFCMQLLAFCFLEGILNENLRI